MTTRMDELAEPTASADATEKPSIRKDWIATTCMECSLLLS